jgi:hypothetical protein
LLEDPPGTLLRRVNGSSRCRHGVILTAAASPAITWRLARLMNFVRTGSE